MSEPERRDAGGERADGAEGEVLAVHFGRSASCSSIGSFVDFLFVSSVVGTAVIGAVAALIREQAPADAAPRERAERAEGESERRDGDRDRDRS